MKSLKILLLASAVALLACSPAKAAEGTGIITSEGAGFGVANEGAGLGIRGDGGTLLMKPTEPIAYAHFAGWSNKDGPPGEIVFWTKPGGGDGVPSLIETIVTPEKSSIRYPDTQEGDAPRVVPHSGAAPPG